MDQQLIDEEDVALVSMWVEDVSHFESPEAGLWLAVLARAIVDLVAHPVDSIPHSEARAWLNDDELNETDEGSFFWVCEIVGITDPHALRARVLRGLSESQMLRAYMPTRTLFPRRHDSCK